MNRQWIFTALVLVIGLYAGPQTARGQETAAELNEMIFGSRSPVRENLGRSRHFVKNRTQLRNEYVVMQQRDFSCGAAALATVLNYYWEENVSEAALLLIIAKLLPPEELKDRVANGLTLTDLKRVAEVGGYKAILGKISVEKLMDTKLPLVVGITVDEYDHFVVCRGSDGEFVYLADPIFGKKKVPVDVFAKQWQKNAILAVIKPGAKPNTASPLLVSDREKNALPGYRNFLRSAVTGRQRF